jgi:hypothetical protein
MTWCNFDVMFFFSVLLVVQIIPFCLAIQKFNRTSTVPTIAVCNLELTSGSGSCYYEKGCAFTNLSCRYLSKLNSSILLEYYDDIDSAKLAVAHGNAWAAMYFSDNFTDATVAKIALGRDDREADEGTLEDLEIRIWSTSNQLSQTSLKQDLQKAWQTFGQELSKDCELNQTLIENPIKFFEIQN